MKWLAVVCLVTPTIALAAPPQSITCGKRSGVNVAGPVDTVLFPSQQAEKRLSPETIQSVIRESFPKLRLCYENNLRPCPNINGRVTVSFTIEPTGRVSHADTKASDLPDQAINDCVAKRFRELQFPPFEGKPIRVVYPVLFSPGL
ncbi:MAG: AgmX/PglI C-terminal domain-containing protein [Polyangiaceae bacterium]|nr:AgmX/PglI C-terminal domain-containing protein [Polyangiaceae bacterium]